MGDPESIQYDAELALAYESADPAEQDAERERTYGEIAQADALAEARAQQDREDQWSDLMLEEAQDAERERLAWLAEGIADEIAEDDAWRELARMPNQDYWKKIAPAGRHAIRVLLKDPRAAGERQRPAVLQNQGAVAGNQRKRDKLVREALALRADGKSLEQIATKLDERTRTIERYFTAHDRSIAWQLHAKGWTAEQIAERLKRRPKTVRDWLEGDTTT